MTITKNNTLRQKLLALLLTIISVLTVFTATGISADAASWRTGRFDLGYTAKGYTTVYLSKNNKGKLQNGKIKVYSYNSVTGRKTNGKIHILLRTTGGRWICEFNTTSGSTLKLGNDHAAYRVYISAQDLHCQAKNFLNDGACGFWAIECKSNTYI